jgi:hypothetical protein
MAVVGTPGYWMSRNASPENVGTVMQAHEGVLPSA